jgi:hypothetical protein
LTEGARERRQKREKYKMNSNQQLKALIMPNNCSSQLNIENATNEANISSLLSNQLFSKPVPPVILNSATPTPALASIKEEDKKNGGQVDIIQLLNKAQLQFNNNSKLASMEPTSHSTPGGLLSQITEPKQMAQWPHELFINSTQFIKPEPRKIASSSDEQISSPPSSNISTTSTSSSSNSNSSTSNEQTNEKALVNPILQLLVAPVSSKVPVTATITKAEDPLTAELKRKLKIQTTIASGNPNGFSLNTSSSTLKESSNQNILASPISTPNITNATNLLVNGTNGSSSLPIQIGQSNSLNGLLKKPITLQDFEENLLNESIASCSSTNKPLATFYLANESNSSSIYPRTFNELSSQDGVNAKINSGIDSLSSSSSLLLLKSDSKPSRRSFSRSISTSSSSSESSNSTSASSRSTAGSSSAPVAGCSSSNGVGRTSEPTSPRTLPLLLTPAAFETSSASSTTSSSYNPSSNHFFASSSGDSSTAAGNNLLNKFTFDLTNTINGSSMATSTSNTNIDTTNTYSNTNLINNLNNILKDESNVKLNQTNNSKTNLQAIENQELINPMTKLQLQQVLIHLLNVKVY